MKAVGFNGDDGGDGRTRDEPLEVEAANFDPSSELKSSDGENNLDAPEVLAWAAKDVKNGDIKDGILELDVEEEFIMPNGDLKSPKLSRFISSLITSWSSG